MNMSIVYYKGSLKYDKLFKKTYELYHKNNYVLIKKYFFPQQPGYCCTTTFDIIIKSFGFKIKSLFDITPKKIQNVIAKNGVPFTQLNSLILPQIQKLNINMNIIPAKLSSIKQFKKDIIECMTNKKKRLIVNYQRSVLNQISMGHYSPIGLINKNMVLIMDVNPKRHPYHWTTIDTLFKAMTKKNPYGNSRGYIILKYN